MKWSWKIARLWDIDVYVHATFLLIIGWVAYSYWVQFETIDAVIGGILFILALFACVVLHEYGHALMARRYGVKTRDITLYPMGGVARLERIPEKPIEELWVALAGPAVNVVIAAVLLVYLSASGGLAWTDIFSVSNGGFLQRLLAANLLLVAFNLIPAFPMDGGRVLRAILAMRMDHVRATQIAATIGQGLAFLFGFIGLFGNPTLLFIAFFVWIGAEQEANMARIKHALGGIPVSRAMQTDYQTLSPRDTLGRAVELILAGSQQDFPVVDGDRVLGILERESLIKALSSGGQEQTVLTTIRTDLPVIDSHEMVEQALARIGQSGARTLPVTHAGRLAGLITSENITEFLMIRSALQTAPRGAA
jgi:Zn-dependent protease/predicted transcriptional regulator